MENTNRRADKVDFYVAHQVKTMRSFRGMSQQELARRIGVTFQQIQKYEKGINRMSAARLHQIADILDTDVSVFFPVAKKNEDSKIDKGMNVMNFLDNDTVLLLKSFQQINDKDMRDVLTKILQSSVEGAKQTDAKK